MQRGNKLLSGLLAKFTGKTLKQISADVDRDFWLDANQAIEYGIADKILDNKAVTLKK